MTLTWSCVTRSKARSFHHHLHLQNTTLSWTPCHASAPWAAVEGLILGREHVAVPALVEDTPGKEPREGTGGQGLGVPGGLSNLPRRQPVWMLAEQGDHDATAFLNLGDYSPGARRQDSFRV